MKKATFLIFVIVSLLLFGCAQKTEKGLFQDNGPGMKANSPSIGQLSDADLGIRGETDESDSAGIVEPSSDEMP